LTREKLLDAAEDLFSAHGFASTSVRSITTAAGVNLAALNYHFGSKEGLAEAVFERRAAPLNQERLLLLATAEEQAGSDGPNLEAVLDAFLRPAIHLACDPDRGGERFMRLMGKAHSETEDFFQEIVIRQFQEVFIRFERAFQHALPELPLKELFWRVHFVLGAMAFTMAHSLKPLPSETLRRIGSKWPEVTSTESPGPRDAEQILGWLLQFAVAGLRAPSLQQTEAARP
jgi:AcrR family transcriptional regulator